MRKTLCTIMLLVVAMFGRPATAAAQQQTGAVGKGAVDTATVRKAIEAANARFMAALQKGDATAATANYADDAVIMMPGEPAWSSHAAILKGFQGFLSAATVQSGASHTADVMVSGDLAVETGTFEWTLQPKSGDPVNEKGKYLTVWKHQADGTWKIVRDINNSDLPPK